MLRRRALSDSGDFAKGRDEFHGRFHGISIVVEDWSYARGEEIMKTNDSMDQVEKRKSQLELLVYG